MKFFAFSALVYFALHPLQFLIRHRLLHRYAMLGATRSIFVIHSVISSVQCKLCAVPDHQQLLSRHHQCILALLAIRQGVWKKKTGCRENLIALLYYGRQLKGEDMKYGMLLGVDAVLFYQFKYEASDIVWKRTK